MQGQIHGFGGWMIKGSLQSKVVTDGYKASLIARNPDFGINYGH